VRYAPSPYIRQIHFIFKGLRTDTACNVETMVSEWVIMYGSNSKHRSSLTRLSCRCELYHTPLIFSTEVQKALSKTFLSNE
jgi:hypothetical protein